MSSLLVHLQSQPLCLNIHFVAGTGNVIKPLEDKVSNNQSVSSCLYPPTYICPSYRSLTRALGELALPTHVHLCPSYRSLTRALGELALRPHMYICLLPFEHVEVLFHQGVNYASLRHPNTWPTAHN